MKYEESNIELDKYEELHDAALIDLSLKGDKNAFGEIIHRYEKMLAKTVQGMLGDCPEAEDVGQEVFIRLFRSLKNFKGESELSTYIVRIGINLSLNELKKRKKNRFLVSMDDQKNSLTMLEDRSEINSDYDLKEVVDKALQLIDEKYRSVVVLRLLNGYSTKETAAILKLPLGTVLSRLARGQEKLKEIVKPIL